MKLEITKIISNKTLLACMVTNNFINNIFNYCGIRIYSFKHFFKAWPTLFLSYSGNAV